MKPILLIDFGSTRTKVTAVDVDAPEVLGTASAYTTVETDIGDGLHHALEQLERVTSIASYEECYACSSAAGGLRMIACGLVPDLTAKAARLACLGAGAKVIRSYAYQLTEEDIEEIASLKPDILLLCGGTDGGNSDTILHNAAKLAGMDTEFPILLAGNRSCAAECESFLRGREVYRCENVMPRLNELNTGSVQERIRMLFLQKIVQAKGMSRAEKLTAGILMPTPAAVLTALELLADGTGAENGIGDLAAVDLGGATTDVYSIASGLPEHDNTILKGLAEPRVKRTVEGDIGMRYSVEGIMEAAGCDRIARLAELDTTVVETMIGEIADHPEMLPDTAELEKLDHALACIAVEQGMTRHAGTIEEVYTPMGLSYGQCGKDLRRVRKLVLTGGAIIYSRRASEAGKYACYDKRTPTSLKPVQADVYVDEKYILAAMGLLAERYPEAALKIMKKELTGYGTCE